MQSQITQLKIKAGDLKVTPTFQDAKEQLEEVIKSLQYQAHQNQYHIFVLSSDNCENLKFKLDWNLYKQLAYNMLQTHIEGKQCRKNICISINFEKTIDQSENLVTRVFLIGDQESFTDNTSDAQSIMDSMFDKSVLRDYLPTLAQSAIPFDQKMKDEKQF